MCLQKVISRKTSLKNQFFVGVLKVNNEKQQDPDPHPDPHQNVMDPEHCSFEGTTQKRIEEKYRTGLVCFRWRLGYGDTTVLDSILRRVTHSKKIYSLHHRLPCHPSPSSSRRDDSQYQSPWLGKKKLLPTLWDRGAVQPNQTISGNSKKMKFLSLSLETSLCLALFLLFERGVFSLAQLFSVHRSYGHFMHTTTLSVSPSAISAFATQLCILNQALRVHLSQAVQCSLLSPISWLFHTRY